MACTLHAKKLDVSIFWLGSVFSNSISAVYHYREGRGRTRTILSGMERDNLFLWHDVNNFLECVWSRIELVWRNMYGQYVHYVIKIRVCQAAFWASFFFCRVLGRKRQSCIHYVLFTQTRIKRMFWLCSFPLPVSPPLHQQRNFRGILPKFELIIFQPHSQDIWRSRFFIPTTISHHDTSILCMRWCEIVVVVQARAA